MHNGYCTAIRWNNKDCIEVTKKDETRCRKTYGWRSHNMAPCLARRCSMVLTLQSANLVWSSASLCNTLTATSRHADASDKFGRQPPDGSRFSHRNTCKTSVNSLQCRGNYSATSNDMKLLHWALIGGLLHLVQRGGDWVGTQPAQALPRCTKCNSPPINGQCTNHRIDV